MRVAVFIAGMILTMVLVGVWSVSVGAPLWLTVVRVVGTAILAQALYLGLVFALARRAAGAAPQKNTPLPFAPSKKTEAR